MNTLRRMVKEHINYICIHDFFVSKFKLKIKLFEKLHNTVNAYFITCHIYYSDTHTVEAELGQEVYPQDQAKVDTEHVDPLTVTEKVEVPSIIRKVN